MVKPVVATLRLIVHQASGCGTVKHGTEEKVKEHGEKGNKSTRHSDVESPSGNIKMLKRTVLNWTQSLS